MQLLLPEAVQDWITCVVELLIPKTTLAIRADRAHQIDARDCVLLGSGRLIITP